MDLITRLKDDQTFIVRFFDWSGNKAQFSLTLPPTHEGSVVRFEIDPEHTFTIDGSGEHLVFAIDYMRFKASGKARFDFGETAQRYGMYKCGEVGIEFLKAVPDEGVVKPDCQQPLRDVDSPRQSLSGSYAGYKGFTHAAWTHKE